CGELAVERLHDTANIESWTQDFLTLEAAGWKGDAGTALAEAEATRALFIQVMDGASKAGRLQRLSLTLDGRRIAMLASFVTAPGAYSFKTAFDENFAAFSPGMLLQIENLATLEDPAIEWTDSCAAQGHPMIERLWSECRTLVSRNIAIGGRLRRRFVKPLMAYETRKRSSS
ncbi:MAG: GNAT family N-acetyltransferase, partial [Erythrobacter sp.]